jgi:hypothetical protein
MASLLRSVRARIAFLKAHPEQHGQKNELHNLQLSLVAVGGTKAVWDANVIKGLVGSNVKEALEQTAKGETDFRMFENPGLFQGTNKLTQKGGGASGGLTTKERGIRVTPVDAAVEGA